LNSELIALLGADLIADDFTVDGLNALLGADAAAALGRGQRVPALRVIDETLLGTLARVFVLGTDCGVQAMHASRFADRVSATDISERALAFARFDSALNGVTNIEFRLGNLFEPVSGLRCDPIVSNPPFVITPRVPLGSTGGLLNASDTVLTPMPRRGSAMVARGRVHSSTSCTPCGSMIFGAGVSPRSVSGS